MDAETPRDRRPTVAQVAARYNRLRRPDTKRESLRAALDLTRHGTKADLARRIGMTQRRLHQILAELRGADGNDARRRRSVARAKSVISTREVLIARNDGPRACSATNVVKEQRKYPPRADTEAKRHSAQLHISRAKRHGQCSPQPPPLSRDNDPYFCGLFR